MRQKRQRLEIYQYVEGAYQRLEGDRVWLPELDLSLGRERGTYSGREREWLYWYDSEGNRLPTPEEKAQQEEARADKLAAKLRELRTDPETL